MYFVLLGLLLVLPQSHSLTFLFDLSIMRIANLKPNQKQAEGMHAWARGRSCMLNTEHHHLRSASCCLAISHKTSQEHHQINQIERIKAENRRDLIISTEYYFYRISTSFTRYRHQIAKSNLPPAQHLLTHCNKSTSHNHARFEVRHRALNRSFQHNCCRSQGRQHYH